jgi:hypothetical protein
MVFPSEGNPLLSKRMIAKTGSAGNKKAPEGAFLLKHWGKTTGVQDVRIHFPGIVWKASRIFFSGALVKKVRIAAKINRAAEII